MKQLKQGKYVLQSHYTWFEFISLMKCSNFQYSNHAVFQMFKRSISADEVEEVITHGETIKDYPNDKPHPSFLILKTVNGRPIHVVASKDKLNGICYVITTYLPDPLIWSSDFKNKI